MRLSDVSNKKTVTEAPVGVGQRLKNWAGRKMGSQTSNFKTQIASDANELYKDLAARAKSTRKTLNDLTRKDLFNYMNEVGYKEPATKVMAKVLGNRNQNDNVTRREIEEIILTTVEDAFLKGTTPKQGKFANKSQPTLSDEQKQALIAAGWSPPAAS